MHDVLKVGAYGFDYRLDVVRFAAAVLRFGKAQPGDRDTAEPVLCVRLEEDVFPLGIKVDGGKYLVLFNTDIAKICLARGCCCRGPAGPDADYRNVVFRLWLFWRILEFGGDMGDDIRTFLTAFFIRGTPETSPMMKQPGTLV